MSLIKEHITQYLESHSLSDLLQTIAIVCNQKSFEFSKEEDTYNNLLAFAWKSAANKIVRLQDKVAC